MPDQMPPDVLARIRALPGNGVCCDCGNFKPQWASISYGCLMCLECSGLHRGLGVHLSFCRSIQMDSWSERQIRAMELSGNQALVEFFKSKGIDKEMKIAQKYNTKQAAYYKERLTRRLDGKTEPPPDPGRYDPATGGSEALGAEALPGENTDQYNARQAKLKEEARERLRQKFGGGGGMGSVGSDGSTSGGNFGGGLSSGGGGGGEEGLGGLLGGAAGALGGIASGGWGLLREKVIDNENVRDKLGGLGQLAGNAISGVRQTVADGDLVEALKRNARMEEGSVASRGLGWGAGTASNLWDKSPAFAEMFGDEGGPGGGSSSAPQAPRCPRGQSLRTEPRSDLRCTSCNAMGVRYVCSAGCCTFALCIKCFEKPGADAAKADREAERNGGGGRGGAKKKDACDFDDDWGDDAPPPKDITKEDMARMAKEMGMNLGSPDKSAAKAASPGSGGYPSQSSPAQAASPAKPANYNPVKDMQLSPPKPEAKKKAAPVGDDFFADFGQ